MRRLIAIFVFMKIILLGYMGSGKSSVGKELSKIAKMPFVDLDDFIELREGKSITSLFQERGEIYFRKKEAQYVQELILDKSPLILATGGGTPCYGSVMKFLKETPELLTIYLNTSVDVLTDRLWEERAQRPLIAHLSDKELLNEFIRKHLFERAFYYNQASVKIQCDSLDIKAIAEKIVVQLF